jgi:hypothetical protein
MYLLILKKNIFERIRNRLNAAGNGDDLQLLLQHLSGTSYLAVEQLHQGCILH